MGTKLFWMLLSGHRKMLFTSFERKEAGERADRRSFVHWTETKGLAWERLRKRLRHRCALPMCTALLQALWMEV